MLYCDRIDVSEGIDVNKASVFRECLICRYWYSLDKKFTFQKTVCNCCHDVLMSTDIKSIAILDIHGVDYRCIIVGITESETLKLIRKADLNKESGSL